MEKNARDLNGYRPPTEMEKEKLKPLFRDTVGKKRKRVARSRSISMIVALLLFGGSITSDTAGIGQRIISLGIAIIFAIVALRFAQNTILSRRIEQKGLQGDYQLLYCYPLTFSPHPDNPNVSYARIKTEYGEICGTELEVDSSLERRFRREGRVEKIILVGMPEENWYRLFSEN